MSTIDVVSTSRQSAQVSDIVIRVTDSVRLLFRPEIVENQKDPAATLRGTFLYQRKGKGEAWDDSPVASLSTLKKGEGYQLELKSGELVPLLRELGALYRLSRRQGVPQGRQQFVRMEENLAQLLQLGDEDLHAFLSAHYSDAVLTLRKVLRWLVSSGELANFITADGGHLAAINAALGVAALRSVQATWASNRANGSEDFWQRTFAAHAFVFSQLFAYPIVVIGQKAYIGGKRLDNQHGNVVDFLAQSEATGSAVIIEIKTPTTPLLGPEYRDEAHPLSSDLNGAVAQVLKYRDSLLEEARKLSAELKRPLLITEPPCLIICGDSASLNSTAKRLSFERLRERIAGVTIVTFDETFRRVQQLEELLAAPTA